jgi:hypothetical protein
MTTDAKDIPLTALPSVSDTRPDPLTTLNPLDTIDADWDDAALLEVVELPSGKHVGVQPVSLLSMISSDMLPNTLMAAARRSAGLASSGTGETPAVSEDDAQDGMKLIDFMVCAMCVRPRFVMKPTAECAPGERSVFAMWDNDKTFLFQRAMRGQMALKSDSPE